MYRFECSLSDYLIERTIFLIVQFHNITLAQRNSFEKKD